MVSADDRPERAGGDRQDRARRRRGGLGGAHREDDAEREDGPEADGESAPNDQRAPQQGAQIDDGEDGHGQDRDGQFSQ